MISESFVPDCLQELRKICVDDAPQNPDEMILQCGNKECRRWQHVKCIAEAAVEAAGKPSSVELDHTVPNARPSR